jgi:uncharacterized cupredoxin-like copper-binding protein
VTDAPSAHPSGGWRRPGPWLLAGLVLAAVSLPGGLAAAHLVHVGPGVGYGHAASGTANLTVNLTDAPAYSPRILHASASGSLTVSIELRNVGTLAHTFTLENLSQAGVPLNRSWTPPQLKQFFATNGSLANVNVTANKTAYANFSLPASTAIRSFEFASTIPYQFQAGMWGFLNVTPLGPTYSLQDNTTNSLSFVPNVLSTPAGATITGPVTFHVLVTNLGSLSHTFTVAAERNTTLTNLGPLNSHTPLVNVSINSSGEAVAKFTVPGVGVYEYVCTIAGHFAGGMFGFLYVGVPVPAPPPSPSTAIVAVPVLAGSAVLLGIGLVLALGSAYVGRVPRRPGPGGPHG